MKLLDLVTKAGVEIKNEIESIEVKRLNTISSSDTGDLSFFEEKKYIDDLKTTKASAVFLKKEYAELLPQGVTALVVERPYLALALCSKYFTGELVPKTVTNTVPRTATIMNNVYIGNNTQVGDEAIIMHGAYIGNNVLIGNNVTIHPNVTIYDNTKIHDNTIIHAGTVIGSDGFGYVQDEKNNHVKIHHTGNLVIEDDVEIGANCSFDRAVFGTTMIKKGTKIDNLVHIAHNVSIGEHCAIAGQTGFAGSAKLGNYCMLGAQAGVSGHLEIGDGAVIAARGGVTKSIEGKKVYAGFPLFEHKQWLKIQAKISRLIK